MIRVKRIQSALVILFTIHCSLFTSSAVAQDISQIAKSDPLVITGAVGTQNTYYYSSVGDGYSSPLSNMLFVNMNISVYGFSMPFSLYYSNDNLSFNYPHLSFNLNPRYKNWTGYVGRGSMAFSQYVMDMSFNGLGVEYDDGKRWRFGAFYGQWRKAINDDPTDPSARHPQYKRMGWGFKVGYGNHGNYLDLYFLRAYDRMNSLDEYWQKYVSPQENIVVGLKGNAQPVKWLNLTANAAMSLLSTDTRADKVEDNPTADRWSTVFDTRYSSLARFAGDVSATVSLNGVSGSLFYRMIQPDYASLGTYYMSNNYHALGLNVSTSLFNTVSLAATFSGQADNLTNRQLYTTRGYVYSLMAASRIGQNYNLTASYNGYTQTQGDGTAKVNDTIKVDRVMQSFSLTPSASFATDNYSHTLSLSGSITSNKDRNKFATGESDVNSWALGVGYGLGVKSWEMDFTANLSHQVSDGYQTTYISDVASIGASRSFLKDNELSVGATLSLCYNEIKNTSKNMSIGGDVSVGYTLNNVHAFSLAAAVNKYGDVNIVNRRSSLDQTDVNISLNYIYTFSLLELKKKGTEKK